MPDQTKSACPFCGNHNTKVNVHQPLLRGDEPDAYCQCESCTAIGPSGTDEPTAIAAWNRRTPPAVGADGLPELPPAFMDLYSPTVREAWANQMRQYASEAVEADRASRDGVPAQAGTSIGDDPAFRHRLHSARYAISNAEQRAADAELIAHIDAYAAHRAAPLAPMCERKTNDIMQREGYEKTGYVLKKAGQRICVSDSGAVAWFTPDQWQWLMFNRDHVEFDWPKPFGARRAASTDAVAGWISVEDRLPETGERPYQVVAICVKKYDENSNYPGQGKRGVYQDWVLRKWPQNFTHWMPLPTAPVPPAERA